MDRAIATSRLFGGHIFVMLVSGTSSKEKPPSLIKKGRSGFSDYVLRKLDRITLLTQI